MDLSQYHPIAELPELPDLNSTDIRNLSCFKPIQYVVKPLYKTKVLNGKVWLLVGGVMYIRHLNMRHYFQRLQGLLH